MSQNTEDDSSKEHSNNTENALENAGATGNDQASFKEHYENEASKIAPDDHWGYIFFKINEVHNNFFSWSNIKQHKFAKGVLIEDGIRLDYKLLTYNRTQERNLKLNPDGEEEKFYIFARWVKGKKFK